MVGASGRLSLSDIDSGAKGGDNADHVPKVVREAQAEMDHLMTSLAADEQSAEPGCLAPENTVPEGSVEPPVDSAPGSTQSAVHLIISSRRGLTRKYGQLGFEQLDSDLRDLKQAIETRANLEALITYVDDEVSVKRFGLRPADPTNPWQVKKLVDNVDAQLAEQGREVRYVLIVGGDGMIPFHRLPNPADDQDSDVPSDNPYASRDANYLIPERAIGRLPDGENEGVGFLHTLIRTSVEAHRRRAVAKGLLSNLAAVLSRISHPRGNDHGLGYSASIWRKASRAVFQVIGDDGRLRTCPPLTYEGFEVVDPPHLSYFNLHGIEDGPNWYGQRDALFPADYALFPLALRPQDPSVNEHANAVVFTEACYGANILGKNENDSIALRFMAVGALAVIGSTKVSYGSIAPPLLGADLIGKYFWEGLRAHLTVGEALRHAKVTLASEMQRRQGYLDDEDQKALISFVLYGDPSLPITSIQQGAATGVYPDIICPPIICSERSSVQKGFASDELVASVKSRIETSLPHMSHARVRARPLTVCTTLCDADCNVVDGGTRRSHRPVAGVDTTAEQKSLDRMNRGWALTLQKDIAINGDGAHHQVVKVVVDESGHILRIAVSK